MFEKKAPIADKPKPGGGIKKIFEDKKEDVRKVFQPQKKDIVSDKPSQMTKPVSSVTAAPAKVDSRPVFNPNKSDAVSDKPGQKLQNQFNSALKKVFTP